MSVCDDQSKKDRFNLLVQLLRQLIGDDLLKERLDTDSLENLKLITKKELFNQKFVKIKTRLYYKQQKFNLIREESEGYAKLITELNQKQLNERILQNIQSLIGCFNLDPNRVLDIILESFENNPDMYHTYISLLKAYKSDDETICQIIGFKYQSIHSNSSNETHVSNKSLYLISSYLLKYEMINLDSLLPHLYPSDEEIKQLYKEDFDQAKQFSKRLTLVNIGGSDTKNDSNQNDDNLTISQQQQQQLYQIQPQIQNQKINLINSLIKTGDLVTALKLLDKLPQWYISTYTYVAQSICKSLHKMLEPLYYKYNTFSNDLKKIHLNKINNSNNHQINTFPLFVEYALPILSSIGPGIACDPILFTKIIRICIAFLDQKDNDPKFFTSEMQPFYENIFTILNEILLPSLSLLHMNPCLAIELWNLLKRFPYEMRYCLYNSWRSKTYSSFPHLIKVKADCQEKIKYLLKRLTKENVKIHGRQIGKLSHNNPIIVCDYILTQIQRYDNFILPIVESLKFMTPLSYDVLSYCTIMQISDVDKEKMKHDSTNISSWLQSVASFCALVFKKYQIELTAIIQYVINQLKNRKSFDLLILQEIVQKMCGIEISSEATDAQLDAMAGGDILRQEAGFFNQIRNTKKSSNRLKEALADHNLILPLCILLSQERDYIVFADKDEDRHLKLTGSLYDQCQDSLVQFSQFLSSTLTTEEYIRIFPKIDELVAVYHVSPDVAFFLSRPMYTHHIQSKYDELRRMDRNTRSAEKPSKTQRYLEAIDTVMQPVVDLVKTLQPSKIWEDMSPLFYTTFWTLSCNDITVPSQAYDKQRQILKQKLNALDDNQDLTTAKKKKEREKLNLLIDKLIEEDIKQKDHVAQVKARLEKEKENWFPQKNKTKNETITEFLQLCIFSRCLFTQIDAIYCAKFIQTIHSLKTPNFSTIICYDRIFSDISYSIASLTDNEARRYGRFLLGLLETVMYWHSDSEIFDRECSQYPGFLTVFRNSLNSTYTAPNKQEQLDYENYRHVCHKWHYKLTKSFIVCLESDEYLQMRNALIILTKILPHYPKLTNFCSALDKRVDKIKQTEKEKRQDIYTLASVYLGQLRQRKPHMIEESKFHVKDVPKEKIVKTASNLQVYTSMTSSSSDNTSTKKEFKAPTRISTQTPSNASISLIKATLNNAASANKTSDQSATPKISSNSSSVNATGSSLSSKTSANVTSSSKTSQESVKNSSKQLNESSGSSKTLKHENGSSDRQPSNGTSKSKETSSNSVTPNTTPSNGDKIKEQNGNHSSNGSSRIVQATSKSSHEQTQKQSQVQVNGKINSSTKHKTISNSSSIAASESSAGGDESVGSITSDELSPKRSRHSSSRSSSPQQIHKSSIERSKRIKSDDLSSKENVKTSSHNNEKSHKSSRDHDKEKKEHRKREHSSEASDMVNQKRSKSDEKKKNSSPSSKRSSKRNESKDDLSSSLTTINSSSNKQNRDLDSRRSPREKSSSHLLKEKK